MEAMIYCFSSAAAECPKRPSVGEMMRRRQRVCRSERHGVIVIGEGTKREVGERGGEMTEERLQLVVGWRAFSISHLVARVKGFSDASVSGD